MIIPTPLPDELGRGYRARLMRINSLPLLATENLLSLAARPEKGVHAAVGLARIAQMPTSAFLRRHTLANVVQAVTPIRGRAAPVSVNSLLFTFGYLSQKPARYCPCCVVDDRRQYGVAYWRRKHQIFGITWCTQHLVPLNVASSAQALDGLPGDSADTDIECSSANYVDQPGLRRYSEVMEYFLSRDRPIPRDIVHMIVWGKSGRELFHQPRKARTAVTSFPLAWQLQHFGRSYFGFHRLDYAPSNARKREPKRTRGRVSRAGVHAVRLVLAVHDPVAALKERLGSI